MQRADLIHKTGIQRIFKPFYGGIGHVLMFHRVFNDEQFEINGGLQVSQNYLAKVIEYFRERKIDIITLDECYHRISSGRRPNRFVCFTFDDGYKDNLTHALPVFKRYNAPFTVFLLTGYPDRHVAMWWYLLEQRMASGPKISFEYAGDKYEFFVDSLSQRKLALSTLKTFLLESPSNEVLNHKLELIFGYSGMNLLGLTESLSLSWDEAKELSNHPLATIGAHTVNHLALRKLSREAAKEEIRQSVQLIESNLGTCVEYLAYPFGTPEEVGEREFKIADELNLKMAFTTERGNIKRRDCKNLYALPRIGLSETWRLSHLDLYVNGLIPALKNNF